MKTLFISPQMPWPLDVGSKIRIFNLLKSYSELGPVTLVCLQQESSDEQAMEPLRANFAQLEVILLRHQVVPGKGGRLEALRHLFRRLPRIVDHFRCSALCTRIEGLLASSAFDVVHVERLFMAENVSTAARRQARTAGLLQVIDLDDIESAKAYRACKAEVWYQPRKYLNWLEHWKLKRYEKRVLPLFDMALVCSQADQLRVQARARRCEVEVFSNGADIDGCAASGRDDLRTLVFLGAMNYQPNEDAALFFVRAVWPLIRRQMTDVRVLIAGKSPSQAVQALHNGKDTVVVGYVHDRSELLEQCTVFVVPIRVGGGTRIKILEAMAARRAIVSTSVGCEGIDVTPGVDILIGDSPASFASACVELLGNAVRRASVAEAGFSLVTRKYKWERIRDEFVCGLRGRLAAQAVSNAHS